MPNLQSFIKKCGSVEAAAVKVGCSYWALRAWVRGDRHPTGMYAKRLTELGITISGRGK